MVKNMNNLYIIKTLKYFKFKEVESGILVKDFKRYSIKLRVYTQARKVEILVKLHEQDYAYIRTHEKMLKRCSNYIKRLKKRYFNGWEVIDGQKI